MKRQITQFLLLLILISNFAHAIETDPKKIDLKQRTDFADKIKWSLFPQVSIISPSEITLNNKFYEVPYSKNFLGMFGFSVGMGTPLYVSEDFQLYAIGRVGYSFKEGTYNIKNLRTRQFENNRVTLSWVPTSLALRAVYAVNQFPFVRPSLTIGSGVEWFYQSSNNKDLRSSFWVPYYYFTPALSFFESQIPGDWFGGFTFGMSFQNSFASSQKVKAYSFDLSAQILF